MQHHIHRLTLLAIALTVAFAGHVLPVSLQTHAATSSPTGERTILLVDDADVLYRPGTKRQLHPLKRHPANPMLKVDKPWEKTIAYCSVYRDPKTGKYHLWYQAWSGGRGCRLCYAISDNGIDWHKPNMGLHEYDGVKETNILLLIGFGGAVIVDPRDPDPARRYKFAYWGTANKGNSPHPGTCVAFSPDGIHWTKYAGNPVIRGSHGNYTQPPFVGDPIIESGKQGPPLSTSDVTDIAWDPKRNCFMIYSKTWLDGPDGSMHWKRALVRTESKDFIHWSTPILVVAPDEFDSPGGEKELARTAGGGGSDGKQIHSGPAFFYNDRYFSLLQVMDSGGTGGMPAELAISHDGYNWNRPFRNTMFLPELDDKKLFDASVIWSNATPLHNEDETWFYYGAYGRPWNSDDRHQPSGIGLATMQRDRFAGVKPTDKIGQLTLKAIDLTPYSKILLNANASAGAIRVELLNEQGYRVRKFSREDVVPIKSNALRQPVRWGKSAATKLPRGRHKIRIHLETAEVFAVYLVR